ncbi:MAG TPA: AbrB/MazE/SpoVT family DNA-binding domain-containing protein [Acidobacteriota bacterium]|nr:AbrB/MazE/SpoVT family DNA-binding domain-containing protein [Acidobacteriota bacterium]
MTRGITFKTKVTQKGQTVVPAPMRKEFGIGRNSNLIWSSDGKVMTVVPVPEDPIRSMRGSTAGKDLRKALIVSRKEDERKG